MPSATSTNLAKPKQPDAAPAPDDATLFRAAVGDVSHSPILAHHPSASARRADTAPPHERRARHT